MFWKDHSKDVKLTQTKNGANHEANELGSN